MRITEEQATRLAHELGRVHGLRPGQLPPGVHFAEALNGARECAAFVAEQTTVDGHQPEPVEESTPVQDPAPATTQSGGQSAAGPSSGRLAAHLPVPDGDRPLHDLELAEAARLIQQGAITSLQLAEAILARIEAVEPRVRAFALSYEPEDVLAQAWNADREIARGYYRGPLHGIPVSLKDNILTALVPTAANSRIYRDFVPRWDATVVERLLAAGSVIVGKTHLTELASGDAPPSSNPWALERTPGGSSSGAAAGMAAGEFLGGIGTDTRGSIRGPSSHCGLTGYRPSAGMVSRHGVIPLSSSLDSVGPLVRSALDAALLTDVIAGHDPADPSTWPAPGYDLADFLLGHHESDLAGLRVGIPAGGDYFHRVPSTDQWAAFDDAVDVLRGLGAEVVSIATQALPAPFTTVNSLTTPIVNAEVGAYQHRHWRKQAETISGPIRQQISTGNLLPASAYITALRARALWRRAFLTMFDDVDVFLHPEDAVAGLKSDGPTATSNGSSGNKRSPWSLAGAPSIALPTGLSEGERMPLSMLVNAAPGQDATALRVTHAFQRCTTHHRARPTL